MPYDNLQQRLTICQYFEIDALIIYLFEVVLNTITSLNASSNPTVAQPEPNFKSFLILHLNYQQFMSIDLFQP